MKIAIIGTGAVGEYYGGRLAHAGVDVTFLARGATLKYLQKNPLEVRSIHGNFAVSLKVTSDPKKLGQPDLIILAVKTYDTDTALAEISPAVGSPTILMSLQNGVENESKLAAAFGSKGVIGAVCYIGAEVTAPGKIFHSARGHVSIGELDGRSSERLTKIKRLFEKAAIPIDISADIIRLRWTKLAWNSAFNQVCAVARATVGEAIDSPELTALMRAVMEEVIAVGTKSGVTLDRSMIDKSLQLSSGELRAVRPSMLQDLEKGRRLEHEAFGGFVVREGQRLGVPVPVNTALYQLLTFLDPQSNLKPPASVRKFPLGSSHPNKF